MLSDTVPANVAFCELDMVRAVVTEPPDGLVSSCISPSLFALLLLINLLTLLIILIF